MSITRTGTTGMWSDAVSFGGLVFLCEVAEDLNGDIAAQTSQVLTALAKRLEATGSDTGRILNATIYLPDPADRPCFNELWGKWLPVGCAPVRACLHANLVDPRMRVEIQLIAATR